MHFIESSGAIHGPPELDQPGQLWKPSSMPFFFASAIAKAKRSSHSGDIVFAVVGRLDILGAKTYAVLMPASAMALRSRSIPSRVTQSSIQCHHVWTAQDLGGCANPSTIGMPDAKAAPPPSAAATAAIRALGVLMTATLCPQRLPDDHRKGIEVRHSVEGR